MPREFVHFVIANRWPGASPAEVTEWDENLIDDAIAIMAAEQRYQDRHPLQDVEG